MNAEMKEDLIKWSKENDNLVFEKFINFLYDVEQNEEIIYISYLGEQIRGKIRYCSFVYNKRYSDFDFQIQLSDVDYGLYLSYIFMDSIKMKTEKEYEILNNNGKVFLIRKEK